MWTLTLAERTTAEERPLVVRRLQAFTRRLRSRWPTMRWLAVLEWHPGGHGWHVHMVVDRFVPKAVVADLWGWGFVDVRRIAVKGDSSTMVAARKAGQYVAKYLTKMADADAPSHVKGDHRYLRPLGMAWTEIEAEGEYSDLIRIVWEHFRQNVTWLWYSGQDDRWRGPSVTCLRSG